MEVLIIWRKWMRRLTVITCQERQKRIKLLGVAVLISVLVQSCAGAMGPRLIDDHSPTPGNGESGCRMVHHAYGHTCVPRHPRRVITLSVPSLGDAIALGVTPIATTLYSEETPPYLRKHLDSVEILGHGEQPSLERLLALKPDLIIALGFTTASTYEQLAQIAPTVVDDWQGYPSWRKHFGFVADVLSRPETAHEVWIDYDKRIASLRAALNEAKQHPVVSFVHTCCGTIDLDLANSFSGSIMADAGLRRPPMQATPVAGGMIKLSPERLMDIDSDVIFVATEGREAEKTMTRVQQDELWQRLRAVRAGRVYPVNYSSWRGGNPLAADAVIDDLFSNLRISN